MLRRLPLLPQLEGEGRQRQLAGMTPGHPPSALAEQEAADQGREFGKGHVGLRSGVKRAATGTVQLAAQPFGIKAWAATTVASTPVVTEGRGIDAEQGRVVARRALRLIGGRADAPMGLLETASVIDVDRIGPGPGAGLLRGGGKGDQQGGQDDQAAHGVTPARGADG